MQTEQSFKLEPAKEQEYERMLKISVYRELRAQGLLSEHQLAQLLELKRGETK